MQERILCTGGVLALVQRLADPTSHERVRAAAADTLAVLCDDGSIAVQVSWSLMLPEQLQEAATKKILTVACTFWAYRLFN